jgi:uncharacterized Fe-S cluster-containing radical SAM superfamily protein
VTDDAPSPSGELEGSPDRLDRQNLALVRELLAPLFDQAGDGARAEGLVGDAREPAVYFDLAAETERVRVRVGPLEPEVRSFVHTKSFSLRYQRDGDAPQGPALSRALGELARLAKTRDPGGLALARAQGSPHGAPARTGPSLYLARSSRERREHRQSRALFDARFDEAVRAGGPGPWDEVVAVVSQPCELACRFCPSVDRDKTREDWVERGDREQEAELLHQLGRVAAAGGARTVELGGNDVLRFSRLVPLVDAMGGLGFGAIVAQSPGLMLSERSFAEALAGSALTDVVVPLYGATADEHDAVTGTRGSFERLLAGLDHARALGRPRVRVHTIALGTTLPRLPALLAFAEARLGLTALVAPLRPNRVGEVTHLGDAARLSDLRPLFAARPESFSVELPLCLLPEARAREVAEGLPPRRRLHLFDLAMDGAEHAEVARSRTYLHPAPCGECSVRERCTGVLAAYVDRHGARELGPLA